MPDANALIDEQLSQHLGLKGEVKRMLISSESDFDSQSWIILQIPDTDAAEHFPGLSFSFFEQGTTLMDINNVEWRISKVLRGDGRKVTLRRNDGKKGELTVSQSDYIEVNEYQKHQYEISVMGDGKPKRITVTAFQFSESQNIERDIENLRLGLADLPPYLIMPIRNIDLNSPFINRVFPNGSMAYGATLPFGLLYLSSLHKNTFNGILKHEVGHIVGQNGYGMLRPHPVEWAQISAKDGRSVSEYGDTYTAEDFAESMRVYLESRGGALDATLRQEYKNRFHALDAILKSKNGKLMAESHWKQTRDFRNRKKLRVLLALGGSGYALVDWWLDDEEDEEK